MALIGLIDKYKKRTISRDLIIGLTLAISFVVTILGTAYYSYSTLILQRDLNSRATHITEEFAKVLTLPLWHIDYDTVQQITKAYLKAESLVGIRVESDYPHVIFDNLPEDRSNLISRKKTVLKDDNYVGQVELLFTKEDIKQSQRTMIQSMVIIILSVITVIILGTHFIMRSLLNRPLDKLIQGFRTIASGEYQSPLPPVPQNDINNIINEVNVMAGHIATRTEQLRESQRTLSTLMSNLPGMAYRCRESTMEFVSEGCFKLTGYRPSDLEQSRTVSYKDLIRPEYQEEVWNKVQSALKTRSPFRLEYRIVTADGTEKWVWEQGRGVFSPQGELLALEGFITDISERKLAEQALRERQARERDINIASKIQTTLLLGHPPRDIQGIRVAQLTIASQKVDGDFFDFIKLKSQCFDLVVGDVMGKGIAAALLGAAMKSHILRVLNEQIRISGKKDILPDPEDIISNVHSCMIDQLEDIETFVTLCYARFDLEKRLFSFVDCGHMRTIHFQDDSNSCSLLQGVNMPLGFPKQESFSQISLPFRPGDFFFFYSDGLTESKNQDGFLYGEKSLVDFVQANAGLEPEDLIKSVWRDVVAFSQSEVFDDDFTCVLVKIDKESLKPILPSEAELEIKSDLKELRRVRGLFWEFCKSVPRSMLDEKSMFLLVKTALHVIKTLWRGIKIIVKKRKELKP